MRIHLIIGTLILLNCCTPKHETDRQYSGWGNLTDTSAFNQKGYKPDHEIKIKHVTHHEIPCNKCHMVNEDAKINIDACSPCHDVKSLDLSDLDYRKQVDSISNFILKQVKRE